MNESECDAEALRDGADRLETTLQQMGAAIAESQAALLTGRLNDLETSTHKQQQLRQGLERLRGLDGLHSASTPRRQGALPPRVVAYARRLQAQNRVFAGILKRMRRNLESQQRHLDGSAFGYTYSRSRNMNGDLNPGNGEGPVV